MHTPALSVLLKLPTVPLFKYSVVWKYGLSGTNFKHLTLQLFHEEYTVYLLPLPLLLFPAFTLSHSFSFLFVLLPWRTLGRAEKFLWAIGLPVAMVTSGKAAPLII